MDLLQFYSTRVTEDGLFGRSPTKRQIFQNAHCMHSIPAYCISGVTLRRLS